MVKRASLTVVFVVGAIWLLATIVLGLWGKTAAADRLTGDLKPAFSSAGIKQSTGDAAAVDAFTKELNTKTVPFLAGQLRMSPGELAAYLTKNFPAVGSVIGNKGNDGTQYKDGGNYLTHASGYLNQVTAAIAANQDNFDKTNDIPASWLPIKAVAWLFALLGLISLVLGILAARQADLTKQVAGLVAAVGVVVVALTFVLGLPGKTRALDDLTNSFRPVFGGNGSLSITEGAKYLQNVRAADAQLETKVLPALPGLLKTTPDGLAKALKANSPIVAAALLDKDPTDAKTSVLGGILNRFDGLAATVKSETADFRSTDKIPGLGLPATSVPWLLAGPALLLLLAGYGLLGAPGLASRIEAADAGLRGVSA